MVFSKVAMLALILTCATGAWAQDKTTAVSVFKSADPEVTRVAASVLMLFKHKPAVCAGRPCAMQFPFEVNLRRTL